MKPNRCKAAMDEGRVPLGHMLSEFGTRSMARILEVADLDFVLIDMEHTGFEIADVADLVAWFKATTVAPFVRVPQTDYHFIARALDAGVLGVMVPDVKSGAEARAIVDAAKYAPLGNRGLGLGAPHTDFQPINPREYMDFANDNTTIICQIESQAGLDQLTSIASAPGVDVLWVGHNDLSQSLGVPVQYDHKRFTDALRLVLDTANRFGLKAGIQPGTMAQAQGWLDFGFNIISYGTDLSIYRQAVTSQVSELRQMTKTS
jgi:2-keto-3-deoxy-L-rhamnonate aldolase RhmA